MPDILIRGMEMPPEGEYLTIEIAPDGSIWKKYDGILEAHAEELPTHGDLIDVSKVVLEYGGLAKISPYDFVGIAKYFAEQLKGQPVVVPAERRDADA